MVALVLAMLMGGVGYMVKLYVDSQQRIADLTKQLSGTPSGGGLDAKSTVEKVQRHIVLPKEEPKFVVIQDAATLKQNQPFFAQAKDGDILLVYTSKVILYSPVLDKVVEVAQIRPDTPRIDTTVVPSVTP